MPLAKALKPPALGMVGIDGPKIDAIAPKIKPVRHGRAGTRSPRSPGRARRARYRVVRMKWLQFNACTVAWRMVRRLIWTLVFCVAFSSVGKATKREAWYRDLTEATKTGSCDDLLRHLERGKQSQHYPLGLITAANALLKGWCGPRDIVRAIALYRKAAGFGAIGAKLALGQMYFLGKDVPRDASKARYWYRGAALAVLSYPDERRLDALTSWRAADGVMERVKKELNWMRGLAASAPKKRMEIARKLLNGDGFPLDPDAARDWIASAADDGFPAAMLVHAQWMIDGRVKELSRKQGVKLLRKTAESDYVPAMIELARRLEAGDGLKQDDVSAYVWLLRAGWRGATLGDALRRVGKRLSAKEKESAVETARAFYL